MFCRHIWNNVYLRQIILFFRLQNVTELENSILVKPVSKNPYKWFKCIIRCLAGVVYWITYYPSHKVNWVSRGSKHSQGVLAAHLFIYFVRDTRGFAAWSND